MKLQTLAFNKFMQTGEKANIKQKQDPGVQHDSETPLAKKPSVLFGGTTLAIIITFIIVVAMAYNGLVH